MPIYEYRCDRCGHTFEVFQKFSDAPIESCEECGGPVAKVLYPVAVHFKGSGFYTTDYGRSSRARRAGKDEGEAKGGADEGSGSTGANNGSKKEKAAEAAGKGAAAASKTGSS